MAATDPQYAAMLRGVTRTALFVASAFAAWLVMALVATPAHASESNASRLPMASHADVMSQASPEESSRPPQEHVVDDEAARAARAAASAAPFCDERGATRLAPPPSVQDTETSLDLDDAPHVCITISSQGAAHPGAHPGGRGAGHGNDGRGESRSTSDFVATVPAPPTVVLMPDATLALATRTVTVVSAGVRNRVERPPRG